MNAQIEPYETVHQSRQIEQLVEGRATSDGAGVKLTRLLGQDLQRRLDPFLMLDAFASESADDYIAGFPNHPHRGFETLTYLLAGRMRHRDNAGHAGLLETGGMQWMTAGRGIVHSEMPEQKDGLLAGFQLWINLPAADKMVPAWYRDVQSPDIPQFGRADARVRVLAGASHGVTGPIQRPKTEPLVLDLELPAGTRFEQPLPAGHNAFFYVYGGEVEVAGRIAGRGRMAVLSTNPRADGVALHALADSRVLLVAGAPLGEAIVQHGPFVMNSREQIEQAVYDYQHGRFGFNNSD
ncbi:hypothetical protein A1507_06445 [Methylomonas koyamae]|uniref:Quercetin 2,3-dioxygenase n=1 Tax=Methylomonas koyamae TaxID=702114 RepID=A0A177NP04_9GAMM|nr:pirin family protein [Methylomonas koyamae]OAI19796.1 hypothetical protein A1507_06445 [Methylomonas koyamae]